MCTRPENVWPPHIEIKKKNADFVGTMTTNVIYPQPKLVTEIGKLTH